LENNLVILKITWLFLLAFGFTLVRDQDITITGL